MRRLRNIGVALGFALVAGCGGPEMAPVIGRVTYLNGTPVPGGVIEFEPVAGGPSARGKIDKTGGYTLLTDGKTGALVGAHRVIVLQTDMVDGVDAEGAHHKHPGKKVHPKHRRFDTSGLTATVVAGVTNDIPIQVEPTRK